MSDFFTLILTQTYTGVKGGGADDGKKGELRGRAGYHDTSDEGAKSVGRSSNPQHGIQNGSILLSPWLQLWDSIYLLSRKKYTGDPLTGRYYGKGMEE